MTKDEEEAFFRADRLIEWMMKYIGSMAPGNYAKCYEELNEHCIFMKELKKNGG